MNTNLLSLIAVIVCTFGAGWATGADHPVAAVIEAWFAAANAVFVWIGLER